MNYLSSQSFDSLDFFSSPRDIKIIVVYFLKGFENSHYLRGVGGEEDLYYTYISGVISNTNCLSFSLTEHKRQLAAVPSVG